MENFEKNNPDNKVVLPYVIIELLEQGIVRFEITKDFYLDMEKAMEMVNVCKHLYKNKIYKSLKVVPYKMEIHDEVLKYLSSDARKEMISMEAVVVDTATLKFLGNFYLKIRKPVIRTKIFNSEPEAMAWLLKG